MPDPDYKALCVELVELSAPTDSIPQLAERLQKLAELANRARAALAQPEPQGPTDEDLRALWRLGWQSKDPEDGAVFFAKEVLGRWGRPAIEPVPVAERLPGPEDCGLEGSAEVSCCWQWEPDINGHEPLGCWRLQHKDWAADGDATHWLPHHALPVPATH